jgi:hypothetical protein
VILIQFGFASFSIRRDKVIVRSGSHVNPCVPHVSDALDRWKT